MTIIIQSKDKQDPIALNFSVRELYLVTVSFHFTSTHVPAIHTPWTVPLIVNGIIDAASYCSYYYAASYCSEAVIPHRNPYAG